ncbi:MAG TPA: EAL domain-containing protein [Terracidiphilus sp.]|nr:EAL domain-containing protein [Terracidiphilus sp.]
MAAALAWGDCGLNLPENSKSGQQRAVLDALPVLVFLERAGTIVFANAEARSLLGTEGDWVQRPVEDVLWGLSPGTAEPRTPLMGSQRGSPFHAMLAGKGGRMIAVEGTYSILDLDSRDGVIVAQAYGRERTPRPHLMEDVLASIPEGVAILHGAHVLYTNPAFSTMFGFSAEEVSGGDLADFIVPETRQSENAGLRKLVDEQGRVALETVCMNKAGELMDVSMHAAPLMVSGDRAGYVLTFRDIGERKEVEIKLQHDAMHDVLTGLPNRALFMDRLKLALSRRERRHERGCAVMFLDLDQFKALNDSLGHAAGDLLLAALAERLSAVLRPEDTAARLGGDEFAIVVENVSSAKDLETVAERVLGEMNRPFDILGHGVLMRVSIGAALADDRHEIPDHLVRDADLAMYRAKQDGGHRYAIFDRPLEAHIASKQERELEVRRVVSGREYEFRYQPIFRLATGYVVGFEALLRLRRQDGTLESFRELLPVADDTGLSISLSRETIEAACRQLLAWDLAIPGNGLGLNINLTARQFYNDELVEQFKRLTAISGIPPSRIMFEVPENVLNHDADRALAIVQRVVECGARVALDNFGANLAPLNHLLHMPISLVKLDTKLTAGATGGVGQVALLESLVHLCRVVGMDVLAQGIETREQAMALHELGFELGQGYLLGGALDTVQAQQIVIRSRARSGESA